VHFHLQTRKQCAFYCVITQPHPFASSCSNNKRKLVIKILFENWILHKQDFSLRSAKVVSKCFSIFSSILSIMSSNDTSSAPTAAADIEAANVLIDFASASAASTSLPPEVNQQSGEISIEDMGVQVQVINEKKIVRFWDKGNGVGVYYSDGGFINPTQLGSVLLSQEQFYQLQSRFEDIKAAVYSESKYLQMTLYGGEEMDWEETATDRGRSRFIKGTIVPEVLLTASNDGLHLKSYFKSDLSTPFGTVHFQYSNRFEQLIAALPLIKEQFRGLYAPCARFKRVLPRNDCFENAIKKVKRNLLKPKTNNASNEEDNGHSCSIKDCIHNGKSRSQIVNMILWNKSRDRFNGDNFYFYCHSVAEKQIDLQSELAMFKKWDLGNDLDVRIGVVNGSIVLRISTEPCDLLEERSHLGNTFVNHLAGRFNYKRDPESHGLEKPKTIFLELSDALGLREVLRTTIFAAKECETFKDRGYCSDDMNEGKTFFTFSNKVMQLEMLEMGLLTKYERDFQQQNTEADDVVEMTSHTAEGVWSTGKIEIEERDLEKFTMQYCAGSVSIKFSTLKRFESLIDDIIFHMMKARTTHYDLRDLVFTEAGRVLSRMIFTQMGPFSRQQVELDKHLELCFKRAYEEFMCCGYQTNLCKVVLRDMEEQNLQVDWIDLKDFINTCLHQLNTLFSPMFIRSFPDMSRWEVLRPSLTKQWPEDYVPRSMSASTLIASTVDPDSSPESPSESDVD